MRGQGLLLFRKGHGRRRRRLLGNYLPARDMHLRRRTADGHDVWVPINEALNLNWVIRGSDPWFGMALAGPEVAPSRAMTGTDDIQSELF